MNLKSTRRKHERKILQPLGKTIYTDTKSRSHKTKDRWITEEYKYNIEKKKKIHQQRQMSK